MFKDPEEDTRGLRPRPLDVAFNRATVHGTHGGNVVLSVAFALLPNVIYLLFARYFNEEFSTHIDPLAVAIELAALALGRLF